jgi:hypothetical protein
MWNWAHPMALPHTPPNKPESLQFATGEFHFGNKNTDATV